jgi:hypothetical protein
MIIEKAKKSDAKRIMELMNSVTYIENKDMSYSGFFTIRYSLDEVISALSSATIYMAVEDNLLLGYIWPQTKQECIDNSTSIEEIPKDNTDWVLIRQIISKLNTGKFVGKFLLDYIKDKYKKNIWSEVFVEPLNERSLFFHKREGFEVIKELIEDNGFKVSVMKYEV